MIFKTTMMLLSITVAVAFKCYVVHKQRKLLQIQQEFNRVADRNLFKVKSDYGPRSYR
jgi:cell division protein FtsL